MSKSDRNKISKASDEIEKEIRRALLGGQTVKIAGDHSNLVGGDINVGDNAYGIVGNNNVISIRGIDEEHLAEILQTVEGRIAKDKYSRALQAYLQALTTYCDNSPYLTLYNIPSADLSKTYVPVGFLAENQADQKDVISLEEILNKDDQHHILLFGEPGSGKSSILRQIAKYAWNEPSKIGLKESCLPILLPLRVFSKLHLSLQERIRQTLESMDILEQPLPEGFFTAWAENEQVKWLFLLDGLDEVPVDERTKLLNFINELMQKNNCMVIMTSRPSGYQAGELDEKRLSKYVLQPFSPDQVKEFAENWFGEKDSHFLQSLETLRIKALYESPLLLTIAAKVYLERQKENELGSLPGQRAKLYEEFVDICLEEARLRGLSDDLGESLARDSRYGLAHLAWEMTKRSNLDSEDELAQEMTSYLQKFQNLGEDRARTLGRDFLRAMGRRSGIFMKEGKTFNWLHPTFREYLAGWHMVEKEIDLLDIDDYDSPNVYYRFVYSNWTEVTLFALGILGCRGNDVTSWVNGFYRAYGPLAGGEALAAQGKVDPVLAKKIIEELLALARRDWRGGKSVALLGSLCAQYPQAKNALVSLIYEEEIADGFVREEVIVLLRKANQVDDLLKLACDKELSLYYRKDAALALTRMPGYSNQASQACLAIIEDKQFEDSYFREKESGWDWKKIDAVKALASLPGWSDVAAMHAYHFAKNIDFEWSPRCDAIRILGRLKRKDLLLRLIKETDGFEWVRTLAVQTVLEIELLNSIDLDPSLKNMLEHKEGGSKDFVKLIKNEHADIRARFWAFLRYTPHDYPFFEVIGQAGIISHILEETPNIEPTLRDFAKGLSKNQELVIPQLIASIQNKETDLDEQRDIVHKLALANRKNDLFSLVKNEQIAPLIRMVAASGYLRDENTSEILLSFVRDEQTPAEIRSFAAQKLFFEIYLSASKSSFPDLAEILRILQNPTGNQELDNEVKKILEDLSEFISAILKVPISDAIKAEVNYVRYVEMAAYFGYLDDALKTLLSLIQNKQIDDLTLINSIAALSRIGDSRCLPDLEAVANQHQNVDLRTTASDAAGKIRQREKLP